MAVTTSDPALRRPHRGPRSAAEVIAELSRLLAHGRHREIRRMYHEAHG